MKKLVFSILLIAIGFACCYVYLQEPSKPSINSSQVVQEKIKNVSKLIVSEGYFSDIITYKDAKAYYLDWFTAEKKAVVLIKAQPTISFDLKKVGFEFNEAQQTIYVTKIPEPELLLTPELSYYDIQQDLLNPFEAKDYNKIYASDKEHMEKQVKNSTFYSNAKNRLLTELYAFFSNTPLEGWKISTDVNNELKL